MGSSKGYRKQSEAEGLGQGTRRKREGSDRAEAKGIENWKNLHLFQNVLKFLYSGTKHMMWTICIYRKKHEAPWRIQTDQTAPYALSFQFSGQ